MKKTTNRLCVKQPLCLTVSIKRLLAIQGPVLCDNFKYSAFNARTQGATVYYWQ